MEILHYRLPVQLSRPVSLELLPKIAGMSLLSNLKAAKSIWSDLELEKTGNLVTD